MLGHCTLGTNDLNASAEFYDPIAQILGHGRVMETERAVMWGTPGKGAMFCIIKPLNEEEATVGNGTNFGFAARKPENPSLLDHMGPWPIYLVWMQVLGGLFFSLLALPVLRRKDAAAVRPGK